MIFEFNCDAIKRFPHRGGAVIWDVAMQSERTPFVPIWSSQGGVILVQMKDVYC